MNVSGSQSRLAFKKEPSYGSYSVDSGAKLLHFTGESIVFSLENKIDPAIMAEEFDGDSINAGKKVAGGINFSAHPEEMANLLFFLLGAVKDKVKAPAGFIFASYQGTAESALLSKSGNNLSLKTGAPGAESLDPAFGTAGVIDLSDPDFDTLGELSAALSANPVMSAILYGSGNSSLIPDFTDFQIKGQSKKLEAVPLTASAYRHTFIPSGIGVNQPSFSVCIDKGVEAHGYSGVKVSDFSLDMTPNEILTGSVTVIGRDEDSTVEFPSGLSKDPEKAYVGFQIKAYIDGVRADSVASAKLSIKRSLKDAPELGELEAGEPVVDGKGSVEIDMEFYWNGTTKAHRSKYKQDKESELMIIGESGDLAETGKKYGFIFRFPRAKITEAPVNIGGPDMVKYTVKFKATVPVLNGLKTIEADVISKTADFEA